MSGEETEFMEEVGDIDIPGAPDEPEKPNTEEAPKEEASETPTDEPKEEKPSEVEELAASIGWNAGYKGEDAIDAKTYILKSREIQDTMKDHNQDLQSKLDSVNENIGVIKTHYESLMEKEKAKLEGELTDLKQKRDEAIEEADIDTVHSLDGKIKDTETEIAKPDAKPDVDANEQKRADFQAIFAQMPEDNEEGLGDLYNTTALRDALIARVNQKIDKGADGTLYSTYLEAGNEIRKEVFGEPKPTPKPETPPVSPVEKGGTRTTTNKLTKRDLSPSQKTAMREFINLGVFKTEEEYIKAL
ncbi:MAG: hypothetical protein GY845_30410 [Planctomycetes bacterium]|nr:hypothetical protein [Planctomycetota bacterium]